MNSSKLMKNVVTGFVGQFITIVLGIIVPRIFITNYGSDVNGLLTTISQIFAYLALLEAGIGQAAQNALYKPVKEGKRNEISMISSSANTYFRKITVYYGIGVILFSLLLPLVLKTDVDPITIFMISIFEGFSGVISFYFIQTRSILIAVDGKSYVNNGITLINKILGYASKIVMASLGLSIIFVQLAYFLITVAKALVYKIYFRKHYGWVKLDNSTGNTELKDRNSYIITEITWTIFSSTDMIVLSTFVSTQMASVYGVYNMIFTSVSILLNAVYNSMRYLLGQTYHESQEKYVKVHDTLNSVFFSAITALMIISYILCFPFVKLYTAGVTDVNYMIQNLPLMFCLVQLLSWSRYLPGNLIGVAGRIKKILFINLAEAAVNLILSIFLVQKFGIFGVLFATVIALPIKLLYCNYIGDRVILKRSSWNTIKILGSNFLIFILAVILNGYLNLEISSYFEFFMVGTVVTIIVFSIIILVNIIANPQILKTFNKIYIGFRKK